MRTRIAKAHLLELLRGGTTFPFPFDLRERTEDMAATTDDNEVRRGSTNAFLALRSAPSLLYRRDLGQKNDGCKFAVTATGEKKKVSVVVLTECAPLPP